MLSGYVGGFNLYFKHTINNYQSSFKLMQKISFAALIGNQVHCINDISYHIYSYQIMCAFFTEKQRLFKIEL